MKVSRLSVAALAVVMILSVLSPLGAVATEEVDEGDPSIEVEQNGDVLVTVTDGGNNTLENATVNVSTIEENASYDGVGEYETDGNGTVEFIEPEETLNVSITTSYDNESVTTEVTLESTEDQIVEENDIFGNMVSSFVASLEPGDGDGGIGPQVASFVLEHNPGNAPDHAGPPEHAGPGGNETEQGPPENAGPDNDNEQDNGESGDADNNGNGGGQGPPSDAGPN